MNFASFLLPTRKSLAVATCVVAASAVAAPAALADPVACGDTITESVTLEADLVGCPGAGLVIGADRITVDLNGYRIESGMFNVAPGIDNGGGYDRVSIVNGRISGFSVGVQLTSADRNVLSGLEVRGNARGVVLTSSDRNEIAGSQVSGNGSGPRVGAGITLDTGSDRNHLTDLEASGNQAEAVRIVGSANNEIADSTLTSGTVTTIVVRDSSPDTRVRGNTISAASLGFSIAASDRARVVDNEIAGGGSTASSNEVKIARNTVKRISVNSGQDVVVRANVVGSVTDDGILVGASAVATRVVGNVSNGNFGDGIDVRAPGTLIRGNSANGNYELGILAVDGVIDGGGNSASGNLDPRQCVNVACS